MDFAQLFRRRVLSLELQLSRLSTLFGRLPLLRHLHRGVTADIRLLDDPGDSGMLLSVGFRSPYLHLPVEVLKSQIGADEGDGRFRPSAFRFFDWHSWKHMDGAVEWHGERGEDVRSDSCRVIEGFSYRAEGIGRSPGNFGLRLAEGVEGTVQVLAGGGIITARFQPHYWMIEPGSTTRPITAISDTELATVIVSLAELGTGNPETHEKTIGRMMEWLSFRQHKGGSERALLTLLAYVRDWAPLGMEPMFEGLAEVLVRSRIASMERILFDFYADNWGIRNNRHGRMISVKILKAAGTEKALFTLELISDYVRNHAIPPDEDAFIGRAIAELKREQD